MNPNGPIAALKRALFWHWHLLALGSGVGFAMLSGQFGNLLPLLGAAELAYLGFLGMNPRFQRVLRGEQTLKGKQQEDAARFQQITAFLAPDDLARYRTLHARCAELLNLRQAMDSKDPGDGVENFRAESLDRMLWLFLKLLHQKSGIARFLGSTHRAQIEFDLKLANEQLATSKERDKASGVDSRLTESITERIKTIQERVDNFDQTAASLELVGAEIDKTEQQITHLCEVGMTARDSSGLSAQVDSISESLQASEKAFAHESVASLFADADAPPLLSGSMAAAPARAMIRQ